MSENIVYLMRGLPSCGKSYTSLKLAGVNGVVCEADEYFYSQVGDDPFQYDWNDALGDDADEWNFEKFMDAIDAEKSPIVVDWGHALCKTTKRYAQYAVEHGYKVELKEPDSWWWEEISVLLKYKEYTWPVLEDWAYKLMKKSRATHRVPLSVFIERMKYWKWDLTVEEILNY
jgi:hypothetical protein